LNGLTLVSVLNLWEVGHGPTNVGADCPFPMALEMSLRKGLEDHVNSQHCFCFMLGFAAYCAWRLRLPPVAVADSDFDFEILPNDFAVSLSRFAA